MLCYFLTFFSILQYNNTFDKSQDSLQENYYWSKPLILISYWDLLFSSDSRYNLENNWSDPQILCNWEKTDALKKMIQLAIISTPALAGLNQLVHYSYWKRVLMSLFIKLLAQSSCFSWDTDILIGNASTKQLV